ncbi:hypothetical protein [Iningainema tapete]|uniref:Uncharacterized protein n=1 Tax=Iningainema tapete BLCC-T55 TaxID=2748662 RepID=A0A8J7BZ93_9CYAN|nr:hypothetical protein [Iningainema tapete]MBD2775398.1 hypothetical protein [Iningainema tapete BLCC-T55]
MGASSRYWNMWRISQKSENLGYKYSLVPTAQEFVIKKVVNSPNGETQAALLTYFNAKTSNIDAVSRAQAGLCLRCYVSDPILKACQKIDNLFSGEKQFTYQDLLPFVLNDDGETLVILDQDGRSQLILDRNGEAQTTAYKFFSVKVLQTFNTERSSMSLDNWAYLQTRQNPEIKDFLSEFGFKHLSDWAVLNRARPKQIERLSTRDRHLVQVFHAVYRRDRLQTRSKGPKRCPDPTSTQLQEMLKSLQALDVIVNSGVELIRELKQIAAQLRQYDVWSYREPLETQDPETGSYTLRRDIPTNSLNELDVEQSELLAFLHEQLKLTLTDAIDKEMSSRISTLQKSKKYAPLAQQFIPGLKLYYCEGMSLKDIAPRLGMTSWDQARRVLNPGEILSKVRTLTVQQLLENILKKAEEKGLTKIPPEPDYLKTLAEQIEAFADEEIFTPAAEELRVGKSRVMSSVYAQSIRLYFAQN